MTARAGRLGGHGLGQGVVERDATDTCTAALRWERYFRLGAVNHHGDHAFMPSAPGGQVNAELHSRRSFATHLRHEHFGLGRACLLGYAADISPVGTGASRASSLARR